VATCPSTCSRGYITLTVPFFPLFFEDSGCCHPITPGLLLLCSNGPAGIAFFPRSGSFLTWKKYDGFQRRCRVRVHRAHRQGPSLFSPPKKSFAFYLFPFPCLNLGRGENCGPPAGSLLWFASRLITPLESTFSLKGCSVLRGMKRSFR